MMECGYYHALNSFNIFKEVMFSISYSYAHLVKTDRKDIPYFFTYLYLFYINLSFN